MLELKSGEMIESFQTGASQSYHVGIEIHRLIFKDTRFYWALNRTMLELKYDYRENKDLEVSSLNRTMLELK